jgi:cytochrome c oxidase assembly protein subunit 15
MTNRYQKWAIATVAAIYLLILAGGLVRASDAGLGCPDWPTCFGKPYPPFTYEEFLKRDVPDDFDREQFQVRLAWIEYTNRLTSTLIGFLILGSLFFAVKDHRRDKRIVFPTIGAFIMVMLNAWLGRFVIESELDQGIITAHLLLAWGPIILLLVGIVAAFYPAPPLALPLARKTLSRLALVILLLTLIQAGLGTNLRGQLETIEEAHPQTPREDWIEQTNSVDQVHRSYSWLVLIGVLGMVYYAHKKTTVQPALRYVTQLAGLLVLLQVAAGIGLAYAGLPPALQPIHLVIASLLLGILTLVYLLASYLPCEEPTPEVAAAAPKLTIVG